MFLQWFLKASLLCALATTTLSINLRHQPTFSKNDPIYQNLFASSDSSSSTAAVPTDHPPKVAIKSIPIELPALPPLTRFVHTQKTTLTPAEKKIPACVECENQKNKVPDAPLPVGPYFGNHNAVFSPKWGTHGHWKWLHHATAGDISRAGSLKRGETFDRGENYGVADRYEKNMWSVQASMTLVSDKVPDIVRLSASIAANTDVDRKYVSIRGVYRDNSGNAGASNAPEVFTYSGPTVGDHASTGVSAATGTASDAADATAATALAITASAATASADAMIASNPTGAASNQGKVMPQEAPEEAQNEQVNMGSATGSAIGSATGSATGIASATDSTAPTLSPAQVMMGSVVEKAVDNAKGEIDRIMPQIEGEIENQEKELEKKLNQAEESLVAKDADQHPDPEKEIESLGKSLDALSNEVTPTNSGATATLLLEQQRNLLRKLDAKSSTLPVVNKCVVLNNPPGTKKDREGDRYRSTASSWVIENYLTIEKTITSATPFGPILEPMLGGCSLSSIIEQAALVLFPPCDDQCVPMKASKDSCSTFKERKCLTSETLAALKPQAAMAQSKVLTRPIVLFAFFNVPPPFLVVSLNRLHDILNGY